MGPFARDNTPGGYHSKRRIDVHTWATGVHLQEGTWRKKRGILRRRLTLLLEVCAMTKLLKKSLRLGESRSFEFKRRA